MTEAYPLRWPDGWPRTPESSRTRGSHFRRGGWNGSLPTFAMGRSDVMTELQRMGGVTNVTISSNVPVRVDGVPQGNFDPNKTTMKDPGVAVYFMRKGRPYAMAQDAYDTTGVNLRSLALAIEAMRAIERHGGGTMAGRAFDGFAALPPPVGARPKRPWWEVLRYSPHPEDREFLSAPEVEARFRALAKKLHPDAGGSDDEMSELNEARDEAIREITA